MPTTPTRSRSITIIGFIASLIGLVGSGLASTSPLIAVLSNFSIVGLVLGIIARSRSKKQNQKNPLAVATIVISAIGLAVSLVVLIWSIAYVTSGVIHCFNSGTACN